MIVAFTGPEHPKVGPSWVRGLMAGAVGRDLYGRSGPKYRPLEVRTGAAAGVDTAAYFACVAALPHANHRVFVPQGCRYNQDLVLFAKQEGHDVVGIEGGYLKRDDALIDGANLLLAFPNSMQEVLRSGTWATIRRAWKANVPVHYWPLDRKYGPVVRCT